MEKLSSDAETEAVLVMDDLEPTMQSRTIGTTFTCFPKLAIELRLKIWKTASYQTRNICLSYDYPDGTANGFEPFIYLAACPHPPLLQACHESRIEGLKHYTLDFGVELKNPNGGFTFNSPPTIYINWKSDRICINDVSITADDEDTICTNFLSDFICRCRQHGLRFIALNVANQLPYDISPNSLIRAMSDGSIPLREVLLFIADESVIYREVIKKKRAVLELPTTSDRVLQRYLLNDGSYWDRGSTKWDEIGYLGDLEGVEAALRKGFAEHEKRSTSAENDGRNDNGATSSWAQPKIDWCVAELKDLPAKTANMDSE
ncbi:hypothetical protein N431DRAFT_495030 [Stipitochalara longipes BDJ]|nr:hypothetical protein N431DRAFT_495030 [Stipitochalara longipes BDJ]